MALALSISIAGFAVSMIAQSDQPTLTPEQQTELMRAEMQKQFSRQAIP